MDRGSERQPDGPAAGRNEGRRRLALTAGAVLVTLGVANCSAPIAVSGKHPSELKYGVASSPRVIAEGEPVPKGGGREMIGKPYVVAGRTYNPHPGRGYDRTGAASWYGSAFHGRLTANGEIFDRESIAAAHPTLPLPSYVRVTNLSNSRSMIVRVNDRGPYEYSRIIDLSERAAQALGFHRKGTSRVRVQYVGRASLAGSDDEKLLASLTSNGAPAQFRGPTQAIMVAQARGAEEEPDRRPRDLAPAEQRRLAGLVRPASLQTPGIPGDRAEARVRLSSRNAAADDGPRAGQNSERLGASERSGSGSRAMAALVREKVGDASPARALRGARVAQERDEPADIMPPRRPDLRGTR